jgi:hypothetical protein
MLRPFDGQFQAQVQSSLPAGRAMPERAEGLRDLCDAGVVHRDEPGPSDRSYGRDPQHEGRAVSIAFQGEPPDYRAARDRLLEQEIELRRVTEAVAAARRALPPG